MSSKRWNGFGPEAGQQLQQFQKMLNRSPYIPLTDEEIEGLKEYGFLTKRKHPKITTLGYDEIRKVELAIQEDIDREVAEVEEEYKRSRES